MFEPNTVYWFSDSLGYWNKHSTSTTEANARDAAMAMNAMFVYKHAYTGDVGNHLYYPGRYENDPERCVLDVAQNEMPRKNGL